jgi:amino acid adenylation domain-containing protein
MKWEKKMIIKKFEEIVRRFPGKTALKTSSKSLTYQELNFYANQVAHALAAEDKGEGTGVKKQQVALLFEHDIDLIVGVIGTLKANKTYVPLDTYFPGKRLLYILQDSEAYLILTDNRNHALARELSDHAGKKIHVLNIETIGNEIPGTTFQREASEERTAYILYTSGSTGKPKGVFQIHRNVLYYTWNWIKRFSITETDRMSLFTSFCHDGSVQDIFAALLAGATLYPYFIKTIGNTDELYNLLINEKLTIWHSVPTLYRYFVNTLGEKSVFNDIRWVLLGGEPLRPYDLELYRTYFPRAGLANVYGQTESSVSTICTISPKETFDEVCLGEPLDETQILLVTEKGSTVETIGIGEIVVACDYIAPGYWRNNPGTEEVFTHDEELGRLYWTGDLGRLTIDGLIKALGRKDFQIKIRGFRVETGEIESVLMQHPLVEEAVILAKEDKNEDNYLCAYIVSEAFVTPSELREFLAAELPDYMIPRYSIFLEEMPLTPNGKIDRKRLPEPDAVRTSEAEYQPPTNEVEKKMAAIWQEVLAVEQVGINDNFINQGGHSLLVISIITRIHQEFNVELQLNDVFEHPTVKELSQLVMSSEKSVFSSIHPTETKEYYIATPGQKRLFALNQFENIGTTYNLPMVKQLNGPLDRHRFETAFLKLIQRHESLRTSFRIIGDQLVQIIHDHDIIDFQIPYINAEGSSRTGTGDIKKIIDQFIRPFDIGKAPLIRVNLIRQGKDKHLLLLDNHHIISDGVSEIILNNDFLRLYEGEELPGLKLGYRDYSEWLTHLSRRGTLNRQEDYWLNHFKDEIPILNMPLDFPRPALKSFSGGIVGFSVGKEMTQQLNQLAKETGTTLFMVLLAIYNVLLHRYTGQEDIIVGSIIAGRTHVDLKHIVGFFAKTLALRNYPTAHQPFDLFLEQLKKNTLEAFENQSYPFDLLVEKLNLPKDLSRNPLFDTTFLLLNIETEIQSPGDSNPGRNNRLNSTKYAHDITTTMFDLYFQVYETNNKLLCCFQYNTTLFRWKTIDLMKKRFLTLMESIIHNPKAKIRDLDYALPVEKEMSKVEQVQFDF